MANFLQQPLAAPTNELSLLSFQPGFLDYQAYHVYLHNNNHVKPIQLGPGVIDLPPQNTSLQPNNGDRQDNMTDFRPDQALWSQDNLPNIIYDFEQPQNYLRKNQLKEVPHKPYLIYGFYLRDIPILPDHISSTVEGWRIEAWTRHDPRITLADIMDRIDPQHCPKYKSAIQMRALRFRTDCSLLGWSGGINTAQRRNQLRTQMTAQGINWAGNTTRGMSWGLVDRALGEAGGRVEVPANRRVADTVAPPPAPAPAPPLPPPAPVAPLPVLPLVLVLGQFAGWWDATSATFVWVDTGGHGVEDEEEEEEEEEEALGGIDHLIDPRLR